MRPRLGHAQPLGQETPSTREQNIRNTKKNKEKHQPIGRAKQNINTEEKPAKDADPDSSKPSPLRVISHLWGKLDAG